MTAGPSGSVRPIRRAGALTAGAAPGLASALLTPVLMAHVRLAPVRYASVLLAFALLASVMLASGFPAAHAAQPSSATKGSAAKGPPSYATRFAENCAACHGADGRSDQPGVPVLAGQHSFYAITQLFMFREGRRSDPGMSAVAKGLKDDDLRGYSQFISTLAPSPAPEPATPADSARMARGAALAKEHKCIFCHGDDFSGGQQVPRLTGQHEDYLRLTLREFREGKRPGYTMAMTEAVGQIAMDDLDTLAYYVARYRPARK